MKLRYMLMFFVGCFAQTAFSQYYDLYKDDFEANQGWTFQNGSGLNHFILGECAGNSAPASGTTALYVAPMTGTGSDCSVGSQLSYAYQPTASGVDTVWAFQALTYNNCAQNLVVDFDYKLETNDANDKGAIVYRLNASSQWQVLAVLATSTNSWLNASYSLPASLNGQNFEIGFLFTFDNSTVSGIPFAIDNFTVKGLDIIDPVISCPTAHSLIGDANCSVVLPDLTGLVTASDNCSLTADLSYSQSPNMGETAIGTSTITFTVYDESNNSASCTMTLNMIDTIRPVIVCNQFVNISNNNTACNYLVPDLTGEVVSITDNCSSSNFIISQTPTVGTSVSGIFNAVVTVEDEQGNATTCFVRLLPVDTIAPVITCPNDVVVNNGTSCTFVVPDYTPQAVVTDNCVLLSTVQVPAAGATINSGIHTFKIRATDELGNYSECSFQVSAIESQAPQIVACPSDISTCDSVINFQNITATDNCLVGVFKADNTGLNSGDVFPVGVTNLEYIARDSSGNTATCAFSVTRLALPEVPSFIEDTINLCNQNSTAIAAVPVTQGTGYWSVPSGSSVTIADVNQASTTASGLAPGSNVVIWNTTSQNCGSTFKNLIINNYSLSSPSVVLKDTTYNCGTGNVLLTAQPPQSGTGIWTSDVQSTITNANYHNALATNLQGGWNTFYYTVTNGVCPSNVDSMKVFKMVKPQILNISDTSVCEKTVLELVGTTPPSYTQAIWYFEEGNGSFSNEFSPVTQLTDYKMGTSVIVYSFNHSYCGLANDTLILTYNNCDGNEFVIPTLITPNQDGKNDSFVIDGLNAKYPKCKMTIVNRWGSIVFESDGYPVAWDGTFKGDPLPVGTYYYVIELNDGNKKSLTGPISIIR
ncbi:MAG: gliding motility-associated C-terminal domain-containing protein [Flavobacteriia bacterium]|nr:gliding motility-associated C-terminal domain-containing protein [Flavobacteriia bacterium]OJX36900.1 MAG: hypothetical protein BGO87_14035 [Flavobacteriia bacterium 40-80]